MSDPGKVWEFIQGPALCLVCTLCQGSVLSRGFLRSLNHQRVLGFSTAVSRSCFLPIFVWTSADNSLGIFQTAQSLLRFLQASPSRGTESFKGNNNWRGFLMVTSYLHTFSMLGCLKDEIRSTTTSTRNEKQRSIPTLSQLLLLGPWAIPLRGPQ